MGLAPLAIYLAQVGFTVSGEDDALTDAVATLLARERVTLGPIPPDCGLVVYSSAIARPHPAYTAAVARGLPLVRRGELLAEIVGEKKLVAVCGSHGKTTTTAMLITALRQANFPAGYVLGGLFTDEVSPARVGSNDWVVAEIDESDGTIDRFTPEITVVVNLDWDHPDYYRQPADLEATFAALCARTRGPVLISDACALSGRMVAQRLRVSSAGRPAPATFSFGRSGEFSAQLVDENSERMTLRLGGRFASTEAVVRARGEFNAANATAALAAAQLMELTISPRSLVDYVGVRRRQTVLQADEKLTVLEDYAHHPAEIRALLNGLRRRVGHGGRLIVVFQPHRFSRTVQFKVEFAAALALADRVHLLDVYAAGEAPVGGGTTADIYAELKRNMPALPVSYLPGSDPEFFQALSRDLQRGDLVAFVGAGDIDQKARTWLALLEQETVRQQRWDDLAATMRQRISAETKLKREEPLAPKTTLRVGGAARIYAEPASIDDLRGLWRRGAGARDRGVFPWPRFEFDRARQRRGWPGPRTHASELGPLRTPAGWTGVGRSRIAAEKSLRPGGQERARGF